MKKTYSKPELEIVDAVTEAIVATSPVEYGGDDEGVGEAEAKDEYLGWSWAFYDSEW